MHSCVCVRACLFVSVIVCVAVYVIVVFFQICVRAPGMHSETVFVFVYVYLCVRTCVHTCVSSLAMHAVLAVFAGAGCCKETGKVAC